MRGSPRGYCGDQSGVAIVMVIVVVERVGATDRLEGYASGYQSVGCSGTGLGSDVRGIMKVGLVTWVVTAFGTTICVALTEDSECNASNKALRFECLDTSVVETQLFLHFNLKPSKEPFPSPSHFLPSPGESRGQDVISSLGS